MTDRAGTCPSQDEWISGRHCDCNKPEGHHGVHRCNCGTEWHNADDWTPCTSVATAVLGMVGDPAQVRCGLQFDHSGPHRFAMEWTVGEQDNEIDMRRFGRGSSFGVKP